MNNVHQNMHFKECSPENTVKKIKELLQDNDIQIEEEWVEEKNIGTFSVRVNIKGTDIGTNGKGVSKEYARASGYAEFVERYQNGLLVYKEGIEKNANGFVFDIDEKEKTADELVKENSAFLRCYLNEMGKERCSFTENVDFILKTETLEQIKYNKNTYTTIPFYNLKKKSIEYLPLGIYSRWYTSNGMCAGNTEEEALVQGLSEIIERVAQKRVFKEKTGLPDIPLDYIKQFPEVYNMYCILKSNEEYEVYMKDCSFGGIYPVAALIIFRKNTGRYGIRFGCHPDYGVAMERTFTEATQGRNIESFSSMISMNFTNSNVDLESNIMNSFSIGLSEYPYQIFDSESKYKFTPVEDVSMLDNKAILKKMVNQLFAEGYDILIRNRSVLGFPTYHIIVPGMSELIPISEKNSKIYINKTYVVQLLKDIRKIDYYNSEYIAAVIRNLKDVYGQNDIYTYFPNSEDKMFPGADTFCGAEYLAAMCYALRKEHDKAVYFMSRLTTNLKRINIGRERKAIYEATNDYFKGMNQIGDHGRVMKYIETMYSKSISYQINYIFENPEEIIIKQYLNLPANPEKNIKKQKECYLQILLRLKAKSNLNQSDLERLVQYII